VENRQLQNPPSASGAKTAIFTAVIPLQIACANSMLMRLAQANHKKPSIEGLLRSQHQPGAANPSGQQAEDRCRPFF
jgi:hypothetical protein